MCAGHGEKYLFGTVVHTLLCKRIYANTIFQGFVILQPQMSM